MAVVLDWEDLKLFAPDLTEDKATLLIDGTIARAANRAPCIADPDFPSSAAAQDVIMGIVLRRVRQMGGRVINEARIGSVALKYEGPLVDGIFAPGEITELQQMCRAFSGEPAPSGGPVFSMPPCPPAWPDPVERRRW